MPGNSLGRDIDTLALKNPSQCCKMWGIPTKFIEKVVLHDWLVVCQRGQCGHPGCDFAPVEDQDCLCGG
jgi:hypothetical protein